MSAATTVGHVRQRLLRAVSPTGDGRVTPTGHSRVTPLSP
jgi:hypothetical protein